MKEVRGPWGLSLANLTQRLLSLLLLLLKTRPASSQEEINSIFMDKNKVSLLQYYSLKKYTACKLSESIT